MTWLSLHYRGHRIQQVAIGVKPELMNRDWGPLPHDQVMNHHPMVGGELTGFWRVGEHDGIMAWNEVLAWIDSVMEDEPIEHEHRNALPPFYCSECGARDLLSWCEPYPNQLRAADLCFDCFFWLQRSRELKKRPWKYFVAKGCFYTIGDTYRGDGFGGARWTVSWPDGHVEDTRNLWHGGDVPQQWRERLPDTATLESRQ